MAASDENNFDRKKSILHYNPYFVTFLTSHKVVLGGSSLGETPKNENEGIWYNQKQQP